MGPSLHNKTRSLSEVAYGEMSHQGRAIDWRSCVRFDRPRTESKYVCYFGSGHLEIMNKRRYLKKFGSSKFSFYFLFKVVARTGLGHNTTGSRDVPCEIALICHMSSHTKNKGKIALHVRKL